MRVYNSLPYSVKVNGKVYYADNYKTALFSQQNKPFKSFKKMIELDGCKCVLVKILSRNLRDRTDLYGKPYEPTQWIFTRTEEKRTPFINPKTLSHHE